MGTELQEILVVDYNGPQGSMELQECDSADVNRTKSRKRVSTMNRKRRSIGYQSGTEEVAVSLSIIPPKYDPEVDWIKGWRDDEEFSLTIEKGIDGKREQIIDCMIESANSSANEAGEARLAVEIIGLRTLDEG